MSILAFFLSPVGRYLAVGLIALSFGFYQGYALKAKLDRSATLAAIIAKQKIDLDAAKEREADNAQTIAELSEIDKANQEKISALNTANSCVADDAAADFLRSIK